MYQNEGQLEADIEDEVERFRTDMIDDFVEAAVNRATTRYEEELEELDNACLVTELSEAWGETVMIADEVDEDAENEWDGCNAAVQELERKIAELEQREKAYYQDEAVDEDDIFPDDMLLALVRIDLREAKEEAEEAWKKAYGEKAVKGVDA
jgi:hypothetical protein